MPAYRHSVAQGRVEFDSAQRLHAVPMGGETMEWHAKPREPGTAFRDEQRVILGPVLMMERRYAGTGTSSGRSKWIVQRAPLRWTCVFIPIEGSVRLRHLNEDNMLRPGQFAIGTTDEPWFTDFPATSRTFTMMIDSAQLSERVRGLEDHYGKPLGVEGTGSLLVQHLAATFQVASSLSTSQLAGASRAAQELLTTALPPSRVDAIPDELRIRVDMYIECWLSDPDLSIEQIAVAHHVSIRTLQRLYGRTDETVSDYIRSRRLDLCRDAILSDPDVRITLLCSRFGLTDLAHFARMYRGRFGENPGDTSARVRGLGENSNQL